MTAVASMYLGFILLAWLSGLGIGIVWSFIDRTYRRATRS